MSILRKAHKELEAMFEVIEKAREVHKARSSRFAEKYLPTALMELGGAIDALDWVRSNQGEPD